MASDKRMTKAQIFNEIAEKSGMSKKDVQGVFNALNDLITRELNEGSGEFIIPDICKLKLKGVPARPAQEGIDPFTKEKRMLPAKPASKRVRATPLKKLKDLVSQA